MSDAFIRNREGKILGRQDGDWIRNREGKLVAKYDKGDDRTRTREGVIVGSGDQRLIQLGEEEKQ